MKHFSLIIHAFCYIFVHLISLFALKLLLSTNMFVSASGNHTDHLALLKFKESISSDPYEVLLSWNSSTHFCNWHGITCNSMHKRVTKLDLAGYKLKGSISPHLGNLSYMTIFYLDNNNLYGDIPQELGKLSQMEELSVGNNSLVGEIPTNLTYCTNLKVLYLFGNNLIGRIPTEISYLHRLQNLNVGSNKLTGRIPSFLGNLSALHRLSVGINNLEGEVPHELCHLKDLVQIFVPVNNLIGTFPSCLYNISSLTVISATANQFTGSLPSNMFHTLPNLQQFYIALNQVSGTIPPSISNASTLSLLEIAANQFTGQVPDLEKLQDLFYLGLSQNNLGDNSTNDLKFLKSLTNCSSLQMLDISYNNFGGQLPNSLANFSTQLNQLYLTSNKISGDIPTTMGNLIGLTQLMMGYNRFSGSIPSTFGKFQNMQKLVLRANQLSGHIGDFVGNLSQLYFLDMTRNMLEGNIPSSIRNCQKLQYLCLSQNNLTGSIPLEIFNLSSLSILLKLSQNSLSGNIPKEVGKLKNVNHLDVSENLLSGHIPETIGECITLEYLYLQGNSLQGSIPSSLASLKGLQRLDLSRNNLSGSIPTGLQNISFLEYFNVSFNMLDGEVPTEGVFQNASGFVVNGNNNLCGGISKLHLPPCPFKGKKLQKHHKSRLITVTVSVVVFLLILSIILTIYWMRKNKNKPSLESTTIDQLAKVSYQSLHNGTDGFSATNLIGSGNFSSVYKGTLEFEDKVVAIKVLNLQKKGSHKTFIAECNALKSIKHRNLAKILTCCSSTDYKGQEFKALIFEYMKNGSLEQWLHPRTQGLEQHQRLLNLGQRLNIITDVASAIHYLHHECEQSIIHCDLKPSNVLLDDDMVAHVSDFGIARILTTINGTDKQTSTIEFKGTIGYAPPEYGMGSEVSMNGDMYSFGILLLEMFTGRRPTEEMFTNGQTLHKFVENSLFENLLQILDPSLIPKHEGETTEEENSQNLSADDENYLVSVFKIGLACSMESPKERMDIMDVTKELSKIRKAWYDSLCINRENVIVSYSSKN
ncbi:probable LRR receptor-like serine/threonine-protein kinase At3g47570 isoform X1 [Vigna unguiculata]|uniref:probable LRR receptor-like serine/threonine-protein kinase At3g47570 isoform X1 n=1 Tax=Vigna unguiculata TaxID=3917 RepID=UPI00101718E8|nr:probable LRR receptor-like serine/threonine-protein kinase At3g47570 isoform X1 [Vigna unguiculata]